ncbi:aminoacyl-tRNA deacylase [Pseudomonadota bacterium]
MSNDTTANDMNIVSDADWLDQIHVVSADSRRGADVAHEMSVPAGAIVNAIACSVNEEPVLVLMAGDMACDAEHVARALNRVGAQVTRLKDEALTALTGKDADKLFPIEWAGEVPTIMDASLKRFDRLYSRAGARNCLIETSYDELKTLTRAIVSYALAPTDWFVSKD